MERLTEKNETGEAYYPECFSKCDGMGASVKCNDCSLTNAVCELLAAYEDTGLTPERMREIDRLYAEKCKELEELKEKIQRYRKIGTVEECREAVEKQRAKKPSYEGDGYADGVMVYDTWICPNCGKNYEVDYDNYEYCPKCGQAM